MVWLMILPPACTVFVGGSRKRYISRLSAAIGPKRTFLGAQHMSAFGGKADMSDVPSR
jgi:hypothetical protein